jgi:hypothetical protein
VAASGADIGGDDVVSIRVLAISVNDGGGGPQRAMVRELVVAFDRPVSLDSAVFTLAARDGARAVIASSWASPSGDGRR